MQHVPFAKRPRMPRSGLISRAMDLRKRQTPSESTLWEAVRSNKLGPEIRRQVRVAGRYIADFYVPEFRLIIEIDGTSHRTRRRADARRDEALRRRGYRVIRLKAEVVERNLPRAIALIRAELNGASL